MSRVGKKPIPVPAGVTVAIKDNVISVKGPKGELTNTFREGISVKAADGHIQVERGADDSKSRAFHGLTRALINNMITGVTEGYEIALQIIGVGYQGEVKNNKRLLLSLGYSHQILLDAPEGISFNVTRDIIKVSGIDKQKVGEVAAQIRKLRKPEPYKGKGIRYVGETVQRKVGKTAGSK
ncbi:MAG: 50S ribosomal protein L6 [Candidatus Neomarinimicrobiota bacterium]|jgi:large subunit ribosomal protein L6|nr:50S ribosomal protein L6 [Candidatus Neomarinimicrobiota bacterium]